MLILIVTLPSFFNNKCKGNIRLTKNIENDFRKHVVFANSFDFFESVTECLLNIPFRRLPLCGLAAWAGRYPHALCQRWALAVGAALNEEAAGDAAGAEALARVPAAAAASWGTSRRLVPRERR